MPYTMDRDAGFQNYPFLTAEEFAEICHHLDRKYCQATLGTVRRQWKLRVCTSLNISFSLGAENCTYIQIFRPLEGELDYGNVAAQLDRLSFELASDTETSPIQGDEYMVEVEDSDEVS
jgi:ubiquitin-like-conjugating enzyme ATG10